MKPINRLKTNPNEDSPVVKFLFALFTAFAIASIVAIFLGYNPITMFISLFQGAWVGELNFGTTLEKLTSILLLGTAFNLCTKVRFFNLGLEGSMYLGALTYAVIGYQFPDLPGVIYLPLCMICAMLVGAIWAFFPAYLKTKWHVNEICVTLLLNYVVDNFCTYSIYYVWAAKTSIPQTPELVSQVTLSKILLPSRANTGLFIAIAVCLMVIFVLYRTSLGNRIQAVGQNDKFAEYIGIEQKRTMILTVMASGAIAGLCGGIEVAGLYGRFVSQFAAGTTFNGLLASRMVSNNLLLLPLSAFGLASINSGAYGVERSLGISRAFIDSFTAIIIMVISMDALYPQFRHQVSRLWALITRKPKQQKEGE